MARRRMRRLAALALVLLLALLTVDYANTDLLAPAATAPPAGSMQENRLRGVIHVHSVYSDGSGTVEEIAVSAAAAGLDFVVLTDHNTLAPLRDGREGWYDSVLVVCGEELSLPWGHALYIPRQSPASATDGHLSSDSRAELLSDSTALTFVAHPFRPKGEWRQRPLPPVSGIEIMNADSEWRNDSVIQLLSTVAALPFFPWSFNKLLDRPSANLALWDSLTAQRITVGIGSVDAHARIKLGNRRSWKFPSYRAVFGVVQLYVLLDRPLAREPDQARSEILAAVANGHAYSAYASLGDARGFEFSCKQGGEILVQGDRTVLDSGRAELRVRVPTGPECRTDIVRNGEVVKKSMSADLSYPLNEGGVYRVEVYQLRRQLPLLVKKELPWIFSNPIYVGQP